MSQPMKAVKSNSLRARTKRRFCVFFSPTVLYVENVVSLRVRRAQIAFQRAFHEARTPALDYPLDTLRALLGHFPVCCVTRAASSAWWRLRGSVFSSSRLQSETRERRLLWPGGDAPRTRWRGVSAAWSRPWFGNVSSIYFPRSVVAEDEGVFCTL